MADGGASTSTQQKKPAVMTLTDYISYRKRNKKLKTVADRDNQMGSLAAMARDVLSGDLEKQLEATSLFRNMLEINPDPPFQQVIQARVFPRFVKFLEMNFFPALQVEAVMILGMFVKSSEHMNLLVYHSAVPGLLNLIDSPLQVTRRMVIITLARIAENSPQILERVIWHKGLKRLLDQFVEGKLHFMLPSAAHTLYLICSRGDPPLKPKMSTKLITTVQLLLISNNEEVIADACWILYHLSYSRIGDVKSATLFAVCSKLVHMLHHTSPAVILPALLTVANIVGSEVPDQNEYLFGLVIQFMIEKERLERLEMLLADEYDANIRKAACKTIRNITKKNSHCTQVLIKHGVITVLGLLYKYSTDDVKIEVARALLSVTSYGNPEDIMSVSVGCVEPLCAMLDYYDDDTDLALNCLSGIHKILSLWQAELIKGTSEVAAKQCIAKIAEVKGPEKILNLLNNKKGLAYGIAWSILYIHWPDLLP